jgi:MarR family 2-MHQ and catechol resistance regulon transcriptional repressor
MLEDSYILISAHRMVKDLDHETTGISASYGLTFPQFMVLEALLHRDGMTVGEIKDAILSSNGTVPVIINNLVKLEMVYRDKDPDDHRKSVIRLTEPGRALIKRIVPENKKMYEERFEVWTAEEKKELVRLLSKYHKRLRAGEEQNNA